ncbi:MAG TPA: Gfo/Idh/MocA family oxidoreductase [Gemmataceae bacterium]|jgi:predicted dehydrogenase|nr:Gfo/Idh/MocA family oxidoreductase [Gemmataceae bacterium]
MGIGVVGVGGVGRYAHLPAYRAAGLDVRAVCDRDPAILHEVGEQFNVAVRTTDPARLAADPGVSVIDLATPPATHLSLLEQLVPFGKPIVVQKPLCCSRDEFAVIRRLSRGCRLRLNLTGRHVSAWQKVHELVGGDLGRAGLVTIINRDWWDRPPGRWEHGLDQYIVFEMVIHHLDLALFWFGRPDRVAARTGSHPRQRLRQANWATVTLEYSNGLAVQIVDDWTMSEYGFGTGHPYEQVLISGEKGAIRATSERVEFARRDGPQSVWHLARPGQHLPGESLDVRWFPDSFAAAMRIFLDDLAAGRGALDDHRHLIELTELTFTVAEAARSERWLPLRTTGPDEDFT